jgi:hypothetical protein
MARRQLNGFFKYFPFLNIINFWSWCVVVAVVAVEECR